MGKPAIDELVTLCREDAARWIRPGFVSETSKVTPRVFVALWLYHRSLRATVWLRLAGWLKDRGVRGATTLLQHHVAGAFGLEIPPGTDIAGGLYIAHTFGCTITARRIGRNATFIGNITVGYNNSDVYPVLGDNVFVGAGARVLGPIVVGDNVRVAANAVVLDDVPPNTTVAGMPARVVRTHESTWW
jgi:serine O-acetyltransferase